MAKSACSNFALVKPFTALLIERCYKRAFGRNWFNFILRSLANELRNELISRATEYEVIKVVPYSGTASEGVWYK